MMNSRCGDNRQFGNQVHKKFATAVEDDWIFDCNLSFTPTVIGFPGKVIQTTQEGWPLI